MGVLRETRAYRRLKVDERRRQLLERATELFATHGYDELSMAKIAREAGVSKPLLYHYFPTKRQLFEAVLAQAAEQHLERIDSDGDLPPAEQLVGLARRVPVVDRGEPRDLREAHAQRRHPRGARAHRPRARGDGAADPRRALPAGEAPPPKVRAAVRGWLWFMDGVCLDWVAEQDLTRAEVHGLLLGQPRSAR